MTFLGDHTVNETLDLIKAKDIAFNDLLKARNALKVPPDITWDADYSSLADRYGRAKIAFQVERSMVANATPGVSDDIRTTETAYNTILSAIRKDPTTESKGDLIDLWKRAQSALGTAIPSNTAAIQPDTRHKDFDLQVLKKLPPPPPGGFLPWILGGIGVILLLRVTR
jgi:hypothetical protein